MLENESVHGDSLGKRIYIPCAIAHYKYTRVQ
jgi:hypothetical protein